MDTLFLVLDVVVVDRIYRRDDVDKNQRCCVQLSPSVSC